MFFMLEIFRLGLKNLLLHKLRSILTVLGIIIGVSAVVAIAAYGEGSKQAQLASIRELGTTNIIVRSKQPPESQDSGQASTRLIDYGLRRTDLNRIHASVPQLLNVVPLKRVGSRITRGQYRVNGEVYGTTSELARVTNLRIERGRYLTEEDEARIASVIVIGAEVATRLFPLEDPLGKTLQIDQQDFTVVGILRPVGLAGGAGSALVGRDLNFDLHMPLATAEARFGDMRVERVSGAFKAERVEISELYLKVSTEVFVRSVADQVKLILDVEHAAKGDVTVFVPLELLEQIERTQMIYKTMMIIIGGLSLLVGGIGIMNIMLATVTERTREIGIRRAIGATKMHIVAQFLVETTVLSGVGGLIGVALGAGSTFAFRFARQYYSELVEPQVTMTSVVVAFSVALSVGVIFGLYPAVKAAQQDPIVALRHD